MPGRCQDGKCVNTEGSYACECNDGYAKSWRGLCEGDALNRTQSGLLVTRERPCLFALQRRELTRVNEPRAFPSVAGAKGIASATVRACQNV